MPYKEILMKKLLLSLFIIMGLIVNELQALEGRDAQGRTELITFVIRQEQAFKYIQADINYLWHICYEYEKIYDGVDVAITNNNDADAQVIKIISKDKYKIVRRASCTDADIFAYKQRTKDLQYLIETTIATIKHMAQYQELYVNATDLQGYTAQNYCYTYEIYQEIRNQGGSFQYLPWIYFNPIKGTAATVAGVIAIVGIIGGVTR